ncbi:concanavalin A-like lectin/glucanase domain-containing protein [Rhexocercosporidium sp. MPI-PUGE-AT-0058]|nr:concanavalin A-like lectin/glucanase domain-containing protein [Rhexocercosporidium sp. MPI-PUGE-AT-0058]
MGVNFRWLVNAGLLILPVGTTIGVLMGVDSHRQATGQEPIFNNPGTGTPGTGGGGNGNKNDDRVTTHVFCDKQVGFSPPSHGVEFMLNPNQWGYTDGEPGSMCMNITSFNNGTYSTPATAPPFTVTWAYPPGPESQPVHAFPNVQVRTGLPVLLSSIKTIAIATSWTYSVGDTPSTTTDKAAMDANLVNTNVAIDIFLDADQKAAENSSLANYEVMVWFAKFGSAAQPIGGNKGAVATESINGTNFNLFTGKNSLLQNVLTWATTTPTETFYGDIAPLLMKLDTIPKANFTSAGLSIGHLGMGSEAFSATKNVTFSMPLLSVDIGV